MKLSRKPIVNCVLVLLVAAIVTFVSYEVAFSHCEIPCGIYGDKTRITILYEHISTIEKSMNQITGIQAKSPLNYNQIVRWVGNKEEHAKKIQHIVTQYFMTQRVKPKPDGDPAQKKYLAQLTALHRMMVHAMKAKQTTDVQHCAHLRNLVDEFSAAYFNAEDLKHIREHHGK